MKTSLALSSWVVHKFGGTSVGSVAAINRVLQILEQEHTRAGLSEGVGVVVSAMSGVTDKLIRTATLAAAQDKESHTIIDGLLSAHIAAAKDLLSQAHAAQFITVLESEINDLREILRGVWLGRHLPESTLELVSGYGELWSSRLVGSAWAQRIASHDVTWVDARTVLEVEHGETGPQIDWEVSEKKLKAISAPRMAITGFVASTKAGVPTTLKRNGSDFSATIFGRLLKAREVVIWTDVDGVYSADPRKVPEATCLDELSYEEAIELAYFGAKVIHPHTMGPAVALKIPILIKNTFKPEARGTYIHRVVNSKESKLDRVARGFTTIDHVCLLNVEGTGMMGVPGVAQRLFGALRESGVSVILISQASSEHSICFAIPAAQAALGRSALEKVFESELRHGQIQTIRELAPCSIVAMVGDRMVEKRGVSGRFFTALGLAGVNVRAIAQGSSERNISAVIDQKDSVRALRATHSAFYLSDYTLSVGVIGPGQIGQAFLRQLNERRSILEQQFKTDIRVRAISNSKGMWLAGAADGDRLDYQGATPTGAPAPVDFSAFAAHVRADHLPHAVIIDCSASDDVASHYAEWLKQGIHVVTPNKKAGAGDWARYASIRAAEAASDHQFLYEATVGAGLPVISTLRDLIQTGDELISVEGILSGTLAFVFSQFKPGVKFSDVIRMAKDKGFTEPDPRDDLSGTDVARKVVILAREAGQKLNLSDVVVESLVPAALQKVATTEDFMARLEEMDAEYSARLEAAAKNGNVLRFVGSFSLNGKAEVRLRELPATHPFARVNGSDNIIAFRTKRYDAQPLIVQGPGAGPEVTAAGVFADLLRLARGLGART